MKTTKASRSRAASDETNLCQFPFADGRQCRMLRHASNPSLCLFHAREEQQLLELDHIGDELASLSGEFKTVADIHHVVSKLFKLVAANRIPVRNAPTGLSRPASFPWPGRRQAGNDSRAESSCLGGGPSHRLSTRASR